MSNFVELRPVMPEQLQRVFKNPEDVSFVRVRQSDCMFRPLRQFVSRTAQRSFEVEQTVKQERKRQHALTTSGLIAEEDTPKKTALVAGQGLHKLGFEGEDLFVCLQRVGAPVGTYDQALVLEEFVIYVEGTGKSKQAVLAKFVEHVWTSALQNDEDDCFRIYQWLVEDQWWKTRSVRQKRPMESVVLPPATKEAILSDLDSFLHPDTADWYASHGIPYKRVAFPLSC